MKHNLIAIMIGVLSVCFSTSTNAAQDEYLTGQELENILRGDNLWCYEFSQNSCQWIEDVDIGEKTLSQWYKEFDSGNKIMVRFSPIRLIGHKLCDEHPAIDDVFSAIYYLDDGHNWQAVDKIAEPFEYGEQNTKTLFENFQKHINCYQYIDNGFTFNGYRQLIQIEFIGGDINNIYPVRIDVAIIPKLQMHGVKLDARR